MTDRKIAHLEESALLAWPAEEMLDLDGWTLRSMQGLTRRANSVWTAAGRGALSLDEKLARAEAFYAERSLAPRFQMSPESVPGDLDRVLSEAGYRVDAPVSLQTLEADRMLTWPKVARKTRVEDRLFEAWFDFASAAERYRAKKTVYRGLIERLGTRAIFSLAESAGTTVATALGVMNGAICGVFSMLTAPEYRRQGFGLAALTALVCRARARGATDFYLQVERDNDGALALYAKLGFRELYGYHYRVRDTAAQAER